MKPGEPVTAPHDDTKSAAVRKVNSRGDNSVTGTSMQTQVAVDASSMPTGRQLLEKQLVNGETASSASSASSTSNGEGKSDAKKPRKLDDVFMLNLFI
jgi:hypothetical protein